MDIQYNVRSGPLAVHRPANFDPNDSVPKDYCDAHTGTTKIALGRLPARKKDTEGRILCSPGEVGESELVYALLWNVVAGF